MEEGHQGHQGPPQVQAVTRSTVLVPRDLMLLKAQLPIIRYANINITGRSAKLIQLHYSSLHISKVILVTWFLRLLFSTSAGDQAADGAREEGRSLNGRTEGWKSALKTKLANGGLLSGCEYSVDRKDGTGCADKDTVSTGFSLWLRCINHTSARIMWWL
jgi:hypothetical protein